tara:strand:- start:415 stop:618 length:204 start_codon:yes stop_codon:yes gene_type:complete
MIPDRRRIRPILPNAYKIFLQESLACNVFQAFIYPLIFVVLLKKWLEKPSVPEPLTLGFAKKPTVTA